MVLVLAISLRELDHHFLVVRIVLDLVILLEGAVVGDLIFETRVRRDRRLVLASLLEKLPDYVQVSRPLTTGILAATDINLAEA